MAKIINISTCLGVPNDQYDQVSKAVLKVLDDNESFVDGISELLKAYNIRTYRDRQLIQIGYLLGRDIARSELLQIQQQIVKKLNKSEVI